MLAAAAALFFLSASASAQSNLRATYALKAKYLTSLPAFGGHNARYLQTYFQQAGDSSMNGTTGGNDTLASSPKATVGGRVCNSTQLDDMLNSTLSQESGCSAMDTFGGDAFQNMTSEDQTTQLVDFCSKDTCKSFDRTVSEWRNWCTTKAATFDNQTYIADSSSSEETTEEESDTQDVKAWDLFVVLGCSKDSQGNYCFKTVSDAIKSQDCAFTGTCCFAEIKKVMPDVKASDLGSNCTESAQSCSASSA